MPALPRYSHTQKDPFLSLILCGLALAIIAPAVIKGDKTDIFIASAIGFFFGSFALVFRQLTVEDQGDVLVIRFGPVPLFCRTMRYTDIKKVEVGRTLILDGWGVHLSIRGGWVWNNWGRDCVVVHFKSGVLRIGTDDAKNLAEFLERKIIESRC
jgi:hypothetical protein